MSSLKPVAAPPSPPPPPEQLGAMPAPVAPAASAPVAPVAMDWQALPLAAPLLDLTGLRRAGGAGAGPLPSSGDPFGGAVRPEGEEPAPSLSPEIERHLEERLAGWPADAPERAELERAFASPAFASLGADEQRRLASYVSGHNPLSTAGRAELSRVLSGPGATADQLRGLLSSQPGLPSVVAGLPEIAEPMRQPYAISGPTAVDNAFASGAAPAQRYDVEIGGQVIPVFISQAVEPNDGHLHSLEEVAKGLAALPDSSRQLIQQVNVDGKRNPSDAYWEKVYDQPGFRSYMTAGASGVVDIYPTVYPQTQHAVDASLIHETGHILSGRAFGPWQTDARWQPWDAAVQGDGLVPSTYARSSRTEDFSEMLTLYQLSRGTPYEAEYRAMFPERFAALEAVLAAPPPSR